MIEYGMSVLAGPGTSCRIVAPPENIQQFPVRDTGGSKINLDRLGMVSQVVITRIRRSTSGISYPGPDNPRQAPKLGVGPPESAKSEGRCLEYTGMMHV